MENIHEPVVLFWFSFVLELHPGDGDCGFNSPLHDICYGDQYMKIQVGNG